MMISLVIGIILGINLYQTRNHFKIMSIIVIISIIMGVFGIFNYTNSFHYQIMTESNLETSSNILTFSGRGLATLLQISFITYLVFFIAKIFKKGNKDNVSNK